MLRPARPGLSFPTTVARHGRTGLDNGWIGGQSRGWEAMSETLSKIEFTLDPADWHRSSSETLWVKPLAGSDEAGVFVLENSPFYAKGVSYLDVVRAVEHDGENRFVSIVAPGGHSTYRLLVDGRSAEFATWWQKLQRLGCTYESTDFGGRKLFAVDVPPATDIYAVYRILEDGEKQHVWMFEEGHVGHPLKNKPPNASGRA